MKVDIQEFAEEGLRLKPSKALCACPEYAVKGFESLVVVVVVGQWRVGAPVFSCTFQVFDSIFTMFLVLGALGILRGFQKVANFRMCASDKRASGTSGSAGFCNRLRISAFLGRVEGGREVINNVFKGGLCVNNMDQGQCGKLLVLADARNPFQLGKACTFLATRSQSLLILKAYRTLSNILQKKHYASKARILTIEFRI